MAMVDGTVDRGCGVFNGDGQCPDRRLDSEHSPVHRDRGFQQSGDLEPSGRFNDAGFGGGRQRSTTRKVVGGIIGGVGGFVGGGYLGAAIEGDRCECDDPGFVGFLIGAPTGAAIGAILGVKFF
jgi:hypothetical protein